MSDFDSDMAKQEKFDQKVATAFNLILSLPVTDFFDYIQNVREDYKVEAWRQALEIMLLKYKNTSGITVAQFLN